MADDAFQNAVWGMALGGRKRPYNPETDSLFAQRDKKAAEDRAYTRQIALQDRADSRADTRQKQQYEYALALAADRSANDEVAASEARNRSRDELYAQAQAAAASFGDKFDIDPTKSPEQNEANAKMALTRYNALAARAHDVQVQDAKQEIEKHRKELFEASNPSPKEIGAGVAGDPLLMDVLKKQPERMKLLAKGKIEEAIDGLEGEDYAKVVSAIEAKTTELAERKAKIYKPKIDSITQSLRMAEGRYTDAAARGKEMRSGVPAWQLVDPKLIRPQMPTKPGAGGALSVPPAGSGAEAAQAENAAIGGPRGPMAAHATEPRMAIGGPSRLEAAGLPPNIVEMARQIGASALGIGRPGAGQAQAVQAQQAPGAELGALTAGGLPDAASAITSALSPGGNFLGIPASRNVAAEDARAAAAGGKAGTRITFNDVLKLFPSAAFGSPAAVSPAMALRQAYTPQMAGPASPSPTPYLTPEDFRNLLGGTP